MSANMLLTFRRPPQPPGDDPMIVPAPANDDVLATTGILSGPEVALSVSFTGLSDDEQRRALSSFPGARRYVLAVA